MKVPYGYLDRQFGALTANEIWHSHVSKIVTRGDFTLGEEVREFERNFAKFMGAKYCLGVANGTDALEMALDAVIADPRPKAAKQKEVIVPVNTFIASAACIVTRGLKPVFVDTNERFVIDPGKMDAAYSSETIAIIPVHFAGQPCDMTAIMDVNADKGSYIIEDAAQAADAVSNAGPCGTIGRFAAVSFHPQKNLNCWGDGGALLIRDDAEDYEWLSLYRNHGMLDRDNYEFASRNSRLDTIHAAVLNYFLPRLHEDNDKRIAVAQRYNEAFCGFAKVPWSVSGERHTYHLYMMELNEPERRDDLLKHLHYFGVDARIHYPKPLHLQPAFAHLGYEEGDFPNAEAQAKAMISLPIHQYLTDEEVGYVIDTVQRFFA